MDDLLVPKAPFRVLHVMHGTLSCISVGRTLALPISCESCLNSPSARSSPKGLSNSGGCGSIGLSDPERLQVHASLILNALTGHGHLPLRSRGSLESLRAVSCYSSSSRMSAARIFTLHLQ